MDAERKPDGDARSAARKASRHVHGVGNDLTANVAAAGQSDVAPDELLDEDLAAPPRTPSQLRNIEVDTCHPWLTDKEIATLQAIFWARPRRCDGGSSHEVRTDIAAVDNADEEDSVRQMLRMAAVLDVEVDGVDPTAAGSVDQAIGDRAEEVADEEFAAPSKTPSASPMSSAAALLCTTHVEREMEVMSDAAISYSTM